jgi:hypothetical protein
MILGNWFSLQRRRQAFAAVVISLKNHQPGGLPRKRAFGPEGPVPNALSTVFTTGMMV